MYEIKYKVRKNVTLMTVYERSNLWGKGGNHNNGRGCIIGRYELKNYKQRQNKRKDVVTELMENNFEAGKSKYITLTFRKELKILSDEGYEYEEERFITVEECNKEFKKFIQRLKSRYPELKYVAVIESQRRNVFHYHMVCNLPYIKHKKLLEIWRNGSVWIKDTYNIEGLTKYFTKDMNKLTEDTLKGQKGYLCSRWLKRDVVARSWVSEERELYMNIKEKLKGKKYKFIKKTINKYAGSFEYRKYNIKSDLF